MNIDILSTIRNMSADLTQLEMIAVVIEWKLRHSICNGTALKTFSDIVAWGSRSWGSYR